MRHSYVNNRANAQHVQGLNAPSGRVCRQSAICRNLSGTFSISRVAQASPFVAGPQALQKPIHACGNPSINLVKLSISQYSAAAIMRVHYAQAYANLYNQHHFSHACSSATIHQQPRRLLSDNPPAAMQTAQRQSTEQPHRQLSANPPAAMQAAQRQSTEQPRRQLSANTPCTAMRNPAAIRLAHTAQRNAGLAAAQDRLISHAITACAAQGPPCGTPCPASFALCGRRARHRRTAPSPDTPYRPVCGDTRPAAG